MNPLSGIRTSVESALPVSQMKQVVSEIRTKTTEVAKYAIKLVNSSFARIEKARTSFAEFKGKPGASSLLEQTALILKRERKEEKKSEPKIPPKLEDARAAKVYAELKVIENQKALSKLTSAINKEIREIEAKPIKDADDKEKLSRLSLLQGKIEADPNFILKKIDEYGNGKSAVFTYLQPVGFLSMLVKSDQNIGILENLKKGSGNPSGLSDQERVALFNYTTKGYATLNEAAREAKLSGLPINDPAMRETFEVTKAAHKKLPDADAFDQSGNKVSIKRSYFPPFPHSDPVKNSQAQANFQAFADKTFVKDKIFNDGTFLSTTIKGGTPGAYNVTVEIPEGSKTIPNGKKIGFPYSAFSGVDKPDEGEILLSPDASFKISDVQGSKVTFQFIL